MESNSRIEMLKEFLAAEPTDDFSEYALALEYEIAGNRSLALFHLEKVLSRNPQYLAAYYQAGKICESENNFQKAASIYETGMDVAKQQGNTKTFNELRSALETM